MKISIIGHGFVGKAVESGFNNIETQIIDPIYGSNVKEISDCDFHFVCVSTPQNEDGTIDDSNLESVMTELVKKSGFIVIKSTVTPQTLKKYDLANVIYNPEFLQERSAIPDFLNPIFHVIGSNDESNGKKLQHLYENYSSCNTATFFHMNLYEASFVKYGMNTYFATKVTFFNQLFDIMKQFGDVNYNKVTNVMCSDDRIGFSHNKVPGYDLKRGYGGACLPKDVKAFKSTNEFPLLNLVDSINGEYRKEYELCDREKQQNIHF